jgi:putative endonuclease
MLGLGKSGEKKAASYLKKKGYQILHMNYRCRFGEIDIIAKQGDTVVFVEVKTRSSDKYGLGYESVTASKQEKLLKTTQFFFAENGESPARFDVISIDGKEVSHIENAF